MNTVARDSTTPKLVVCDLDQGLLGNRDAEAELLETWMAWEDRSRPILLFHSDLSIEELQHSLLGTILPPANFLIGAGMSMLVRLTAWQKGIEGSRLLDRWTGIEPGQLLAAAVSRALTGRDAVNNEKVCAFPRVTHAVLTNAGLLVTFETSERPARCRRASVALSWIVAQLCLDADQICAYVPSVEPCAGAQSAAAYVPS